MPSAGEKELEVETLREELARAKRTQEEVEQIAEAYEKQAQNVTERLATSEKHLVTAEERLQGMLP